VCLVWSDDGQPDRSRMATGPAALGERESCKTLRTGAGATPPP
jgi:hypothetical protein